MVKSLIVEVSADVARDGGVLSFRPVAARPDLTVNDLADAVDPSASALGRDEPVEASSSGDDARTDGVGAEKRQDCGGEGAEGQPRY